MLSVLFIINLVLTLLYVCINGIKKDTLGIALLFIFLPIIGLAIYFIPRIIQKFLNDVGVDKEAILISASDVDKYPEHPNIEEELNIAPLEDLIIVRENTEKKNILLSQIKDGLSKNYQTLFMLENDTDLDTMHYVSTIKMEIYRQCQTRWLECRDDYENNPNDAENFHSACDALIEILRSKVYSEKELNMYRKKLCDIVEYQIEIDDSIISYQEFKTYLNVLVALNRNERAETVWVKYKVRIQSEETYNTMFKMFYTNKEQEKLKETLFDLKKNNRIELTAKGFETLKYLEKNV